MADFWGKKKKRGPSDFEDPFGDIFGEFFDDEFPERMREMMEQMRRSLSNEGLPRVGGAQEGMIRNQPRIYGFSIKMGQDRKPIIEEFGNVRPGEQPMMKKEREPLVDVLSKPREITVLAELPGVQKKDIRVKVIGDDDVLHINVPNKFDKKVKLPVRVKPKQTKASYKNGVLEVNLVRVKEAKKAKKKRDKDEIPVE